MGKPSTPEAIAKWAEGQTLPADSPAYKRLTDTERVLALKLAQDGLTQVEIAQRLGRAQSTISDWLAKCEDTTLQATRYLRGQALRMARKVAASDDGKVLVQALKGVNVLQEQQQQGITVLVGGGGQVLIAQGEAPHVSVDAQRLSPPLSLAQGPLSVEQG